jgi:hypothetical protein
MMGHKYKHLIGIPYEEKDCYQIAQAFYKCVFNKNLKDYYTEIPENSQRAENMIHFCREDFYEVKEPKFGDLILIRLYGIECHIGVRLEEGLMLHTTKGANCRVESLHRWRHLIVGYYRMKEK